MAAHRQGTNAPEQRRTGRQRRNTTNARDAGSRDALGGILTGNRALGRTLGHNGPTQQRHDAHIVPTDNDAKQSDAPTSDGNLPAQFRMKMEDSFGADFTDVRVHENSNLARSLRAIAVTQGRNIYFAPGMYRPNSPHGQEVLRHELAHVIQSREGRVEATHEELGHAISERPDLEAEADRISEAAGRGAKISGLTRTALRTASGAEHGGAPLQLYRSLPTGATILGIQPDLDNIYLACSNLANRVESRVAGNVNWALRIGRELESSIASNRLVPFRKSFTETTGINFDWTVTINWRINNEREVGGATTTEVTRSGGGSSTLSSSTSTSTTDSASASGTVGGHEGAPGGGAEIGTSTTQGQTESMGTTLQGGVSRKSEERARSYSAELVAMIAVSGSANFSGSDYINPFKWGTSIGSAITTSGTQGPVAYHGGRIDYQDSRPT